MTRKGTSSSRESATLQARELSKTFGFGDTAVCAVDQVSLDVHSGELVLIKGPSGSGKTTLLSMLGGLLRPDHGEVLVEGQPIAGLAETALADLRAQRIGFIFQAYNLLSALSVEDNILFPARLVGAPLGAARQRARELMERLQLTHRRRSRPAKLSGGERQRVAVARALVNDPPLILADEPTGNLDSYRGQEVAMLLHEIAREDGRAVVIVTHDPRIEDIADHVLWLEDGRLRDRREEAHEWARDPVCNMQVDRWTATERSAFAGKEYVFCSASCRELFSREPQHYLQQDQTPQPGLNQEGV